VKIACTLFAYTSSYISFFFVPGPMGYLCNPDVLTMGSESSVFFPENSMALLYSKIFNFCFCVQGVLGRAGHGEEQSHGGLLGVV
jgi:hypothetical protein